MATVFVFLSSDCSGTSGGWAALIGGNDVIETLRFWQSPRVHSELRNKLSCISGEACWYQSPTGLQPAAHMTR